ncbi:MAG: glycosyltransferase [Candidatus Omnitrophica bacterium]|nr:glycosyltransferase [Candidatus Omnitrophota bacterium]MCB9721575.1 glycosyltransferase [Candidatus Omnitrophota bacterium]
MRVPSPIKVLFVHPNNKLTGQEFSLLERMIGLRRIGGTECALLLPEEGDFSALVKKEDFSVRHIPMPRLKKLNPVPYLKTVFAVKKLIQTDGIHVVHCSGIYPNQFCLPAARMSDVPVIGQVTTTVYNDYDISSNFVSKIDLLITCSLAAKKHLEGIPELATGLKPENIHCVYDGISENTHKFTDEQIAVLRAEFGIAEDDQVVGQLSEVIPRKGCEYFVEMAREVKQALPKTKFLIIGKSHRDEYEENLRRSIAEHGLEKDVLLTGFRKDFYAFLQLMDVSVLASLAEGLGRVIVESQYMEKPMVATAVSGNVEAIEDGKSGFLVPPEDPSALADKVIRLLKDEELRRKLGASGYLSAKNKFSIDGHAAALREIYVTLLKSL